MLPEDIQYAGWVVDTRPLVKCVTKLTDAVNPDDRPAAIMTVAFITLEVAHERGVWIRQGPVVLYM